MQSNARRPFCATLVLFLVCALSMCCFAAKTHHCRYDEVKPNKNRTLSYSLVKELPVRGQGKWEAYTATGSDGSAPLRFHVSNLDLFDDTKYCTAEKDERRIDFFDGNERTCEEYYDLTDANRAILLQRNLPAALQLHSERLMVQPVRGMLVMPANTLHNSCDRFTIPDAHRSTGVEADFILYVAAAPYTTFALTCSIERSTKRPTSGALNVAPDVIEKTRHSIRIIAHEIAHALGFNYDTFRDIGMTRTSYVNVVYKRFHCVNSKTLLATAKEHYNCPNMKCLNLEDGGKEETVKHSHWERTHAKDDLMSMYMGPSGGFYTALTLATFADTKFYTVNMDKAEAMRWGKNAGCDFLNRSKKCMTKGISPFPEMFCNQTEEVDRCTFDRLSLGTCGIKVSTHLKGHQYFAERNRVAISPLMGECPAVDAQISRSCLDGDEELMPGSIIGATSRCLKAVGLEEHTPNKYEILVGDICANVQCEADKKVKIQYKGDTTWYECTDGMTIAPKKDSHFKESTGHIVCPKYEEVCFHSIPERETQQNVDPNVVQSTSTDKTKKTEIATNTTTSVDATSNSADRQKETKPINGTTVEPERSSETKNTNGSKTDSTSGKDGGKGTKEVESKTGSGPEGENKEIQSSGKGALNETEENDGSVLHTTSLLIAAIVAAIVSV